MERRFLIDEMPITPSFVVASNARVVTQACLATSSRKSSRHNLFERAVVMWKSDVGSPTFSEDTEALAEVAKVGLDPWARRGHSEMAAPQAHAEIRNQGCIAARMHNGRRDFAFDSGH